MTQTTMNATVSHATTSGLRARFQAWLAGRAAHKARMKVYRTTVNELSAMSDRDLNDIGINRLLIEQVAHDAAFGGK
jgi:uncharacterized protein YjiS (DUF1127 family)